MEHPVRCKDELVIDQSSYEENQESEIYLILLQVGESLNQFLDFQESIKKWADF